jgi:hypothetical protein
MDFGGNVERRQKSVDPFVPVAFSVSARFQIVMAGLAGSIIASP